MIISNALPIKTITMNQKWLREWPCFFLFLLIIGFLVTHSPEPEYDTDPSYILFGASRPPLYPFFIWLFHYQFTLIMWTQGFFLFIALLYARHWMIEKLQVSDFSIFFVLLCVLFTIVFHFQIRFIQSEGLAFPLFIYSFFLLIECFWQFDLKKIVYLAVIVSLLVLTRLQFYYYYIIFILLCFRYIGQRIPMRSTMLAAMILFGSMGLTTLVDHGYHYIKHGFFGAAPYSELMILVQTLYLADNSSVQYVRNPVEKHLLENMLNQRNSQHLNLDASLVTSMKPSYLQHAYQEYSRNYLAIQDVIGQTLQTSVENQNGVGTSFQANQTALNMNSVLISHELKKNLVFLLWKFVACMGGVPVFLFFLLLLLSLSFKMLKPDTKSSIDIAFLATIPIVTFLNAAIIAVCNPDLPVYFCYSQFMLYCLAAFLATKVVFNKSGSLIELK